jgi:hypothetical protein
MCLVIASALANFVYSHFFISVLFCYICRLLRRSVKQDGVFVLTSNGEDLEGSICGLEVIFV